MDDRFGARIASLRRAQGMTQEALGQAVGVSAAAVSKWETGASCPDIALLCPLCRALCTTVDALLAFESDISPQELNRRAEEIVTLARQGDRQGAQAVLDAMLREYPSSAAAAFNGALLMDTFAMLAMVDQDVDEPQKAAWQAQKRALLERVRACGDVQYAQAAIQALASMELAQGALERAQALVDSLPKENIDPGDLRVRLAIRQGQVQQAQKLAQQTLYRHLVSALRMLSMLLEEPLCPDAAQAMQIADVYAQIDALTGVGGGFGAGLMMMTQLRAGDTQGALASLERLTRLLTQGGTGPNALLFSAAYPKAGQQAKPRPELARLMLRGLLEEEQVSALRGAPQYERAIALLSQEE